MSKAHATALRVGRNALDERCRDLAVAQDQVDALAAAQSRLLDQLLDVAPAGDLLLPDGGWRRRLIQQRAVNAAAADGLEREAAALREAALAQFAALRALERAADEWQAVEARRTARRAQAAADDHALGRHVAGTRR